MAKRRYSNILGGRTSNSLVARFLAILQCDKFYEILRAKALRMTSVERGGKMPNIYPRGDRRGFDSSFVKKAAFTLAEVLITLGVIGIVAAMTLPNLLYSMKEKRMVTQLQQAYSILNNAVRMTTVENGPLNTWADDSREFFEAELSKHLKIFQKNTAYNDVMKSGGFNWHSVPTYNVANGMSIQIQRRMSNREGVDSWQQCRSTVAEASLGKVFTHYTYCGVLNVDINGPSKPNKKGEDVFSFNIFADGILPKGGGYHEVWHDTFERGCLGDNKDMCTGWVLKNKNLDYLRCPDDLVWGKVTSCPKK